MRNVLFYMLFAMLFASCSANKYLPEGEKYFEGHKTAYTVKTAQVPKDVRYYLQEDLKPEATRRFFFSRPGTWLYEVMGEPKKDKGLRHWIKHKSRFLILAYLRQWSLLQKGYSLFSEPFCL